MLHLNPNEVIIFNGTEQRVQPDLMGSPTDMELKGSCCRFKIYEGDNSLPPSADIPVIPKVLMTDAVMIPASSDQY